MALTTHKLSSAEISARNLKRLGDTTTGTSDYIQGLVDELPEYIAAKHNALIDEVVTELSGKLTATDTDDITDTADNRFVSDTEKSTWNGKLSPSGSANDLTFTDTNSHYATDEVGEALVQAGAEIDAVETQIIEKTSYGVITGLVTAQQTVADMTVKVSAGTIYMANGDRFTPAATASLAVTTADATNPRIDIVYVSSTGVVSYLAGTAGASPAQPATPAGGQLLATILVTAGKTSILTADITQRKRSLGTEDWITPTLLNGWTVGSGYAVSYRKDADGVVHLRGRVDAGSSSQIMALPVGYRPSYTAGFACMSTAYARCTVGVGGEVNAYSYTSYVFLDGISFSAV
jgi:hypothetical protein